MVRVTKEFSFEAAHLLVGYDGLCRHIHGHSYRLFVTIRGEVERSGDSPKCGMLMDFKDLKSIVNEQVVTRLDHALIVRRGDNSLVIGSLTCEGFGNVVEVDYQPTCENMVEDFAARITSSLPQDVELYSIKLYETATSYAEWFASDN